MTRKLRVRALYESGGELNSQCSGHIRLLRPLSHPTVADRIELSSGRRFDGGQYDAVIVERLWRGTITIPAIEALVHDVKKSGAKLIYAQDDNMFDLRHHLANQEWLDERHVTVMKFLQASSVGLVVSTERLKQRLSEFHDHIEVVENAIDERLIASSPTRATHDPDDEQLVVGFMGTRSHDEDLQMIAPALRAAHERFGDRLRLEIIGGLAQEAATSRALGLPIHARSTDGELSDYPLFFPWFTDTVKWDVGLAPLRDNPYNACKSDIKWLDYSAVGAAGIFSAVPPYESVEHGVTGLVVPNDPAAWRDALMSLLSDPHYRGQIARQARRRFFGSRTLRTCAVQWADAITRLLS